MKRIFHKILSVLMAFLVLFSTLSFTIDMHFCGDTLVDSAIFQKVKTCGMEMQNPSSEGCTIKVKDCCSDRQLVIDGQDELKVSFDSLSFDQQVFVASFIYSYFYLFESLEENATTFGDYSPPVVIRQIYKLDETYLI